MKYAMEIVGAVMTRRKPQEQDDSEYVHGMFVVVRAGFQMAVLLERFGRDGQQLVAWDGIQWDSSITQECS